MTGGHLGAVVLAEYDEGLLPDRLAADVAEHLAHCSTCTETHRQLAEVSRRLTAEPATLPTPPDVAARLDVALARERASAAAEETDLVRRRIGSIAATRPWRSRMPTLLAAAATVAAVAFAGLVVGTGSGGDDADEGRTTVAEGGNDQLADEAAKPVPNAGADAGTAPARAALTEQIQQIVIHATSGIASDETDVDGSPETQSKQDNTARCGAALASDVGRDLIGAAPTDLDTAGAVLVVTTASTDGAVQGWVLPTCDATASDALATLTVPTR
jgi:negative regulator of sigma E activity